MLCCLLLICLVACLVRVCCGLGFMVCIGGWFLWFVVCDTVERWVVNSVVLLRCLPLSCHL